MLAGDRPNARVRLGGWGRYQPLSPWTGSAVWSWASSNGPSPAGTWTFKRYAAMISAMTFEQVVDAHEAYLAKRGLPDADEAAERIGDSLDLPPDEAAPTRPGSCCRGVAWPRASPS